MRPPNNKEGLKIARWQLTEWFEWRNSGLWSSETDFQTSIPFSGEDEYLRRVLDIEIPAEFTSPDLDYAKTRHVTAKVEDLANLPIAQIPILQAYYKILVERHGKDSFAARFYLKYADSWYPKHWCRRELNRELARTGNTWSKRLQNAFIIEAKSSKSRAGRGELKPLR